MAGSSSTTNTNTNKSGWSQMSHKSGWVASNQERYERFKNNMLHGEDWSQGLKFFAIYWVRFRHRDGSTQTLHSPMFENTEPQPGSTISTHAEESMLDHLKLLLSGFDCRRLVSVHIMQDASPCRRCCDRYRQDLGWLLNLPWRMAPMEVTIIFSAFYKVLRPYCRQEKHSHVAWMEQSQSNANMKAMDSLVDSGFCLRTTEYDDWQCLRKALQLHPLTRETYDMSARRREDDLLREDLYILAESRSHRT